LANFESRIIEYSAEFDAAKERVSQYEADMMAAANGFTAIESDAEKERREEVETIMQARADLSDAKADMKDAMESKEAKEATRAKHEKNMKAMTAELEASNESLTDIEQLIASVPEGERADLEA
jgi:septal ring factor EnvC (AmiA/AmiB activator)